MVGLVPTIHVFTRERLRDALRRKPLTRHRRRKTWMVATRATMTGEARRRVLAVAHPAPHHARMKEKGGWVYMMTNQPNGTLYLVVTSNLARRVYEHREGLCEGFTKRYGLKCLVWYEWHDDIESAIQRETSMKRWYRAYKTRTIMQHNPDWRDLYEELA